MGIAVFQNSCIIALPICCENLFWSSITNHIPGRYSKHPEHHSGCCCKMHAVAFLCIVQEGFHKILSLRKLIHIQFVGTLADQPFYHILADLLIFISNVPVRTYISHIRLAPMLFFFLFGTFLFQLLQPLIRYLKVAGAAVSPVGSLCLIQHAIRLLTVTIAFHGLFVGIPPVKRKNIILGSLSSHIIVPAIDLIIIIKKSIVWHICILCIGIFIFHSDLCGRHRLICRCFIIHHPQKRQILNIYRRIPLRLPGQHSILKAFSVTRFKTAACISFSHKAFQINGFLRLLAAGHLQCIHTCEKIAIHSA